MMMEYYKNLGGNSNIIAFEIGAGEITVEFGDGSVYQYTNHSAGTASISEMHRLARTGQGLNSYISKVVKKGYARKIR